MAGPTGPTDVTCERCQYLQHYCVCEPIDGQVDMFEIIEP